jgi:hypothetical protein
MKHLIIDVETMGIHEESVILQWTAALYDTKDQGDDPDALLEHVKIFDIKLNAKLQVEYGRKVDQDALKFWKSQPHEVQLQSLIPNAEKDVDPEIACQMFEDWLKENGFNKKTDMVWQRGTQDILWLTSIFQSCGWIFEKLPFAWYRVRDIRTAVDVLGLSTKLNGYPDCTEDLRSMVPNYKQHDARSDVLFECCVLRLAGII